MISWALLKTLFLAPLESGQVIICRMSQIHQLTIRLLTLLVFLMSFWKEKDREQVFMFVNLFFFCLITRRGRPHWNRPSSIQLQPFVIQKRKRKKKLMKNIMIQVIQVTHDTWHLTSDKCQVTCGEGWTLSQFSVSLLLQFLRLRSYSVWIHFQNYELLFWLSVALMLIIWPKWDLKL